jgi:hypothetical protein
MMLRKQLGVLLLIPCQVSGAAVVCLQGVAVKTKDYLGRTAMQYASNEAAADFLEKRANQTIPYEGREYLQLRVDTEVKKGPGVTGLAT